MATRLRVALVAACLAALALAAPAHAAFPGADGKIAFASNRDGNFEIYTVDPDGTNLQRLTHTAADESMPAWSPDGSRIAFQRRDPPTGNIDVWTMFADGSGQVDVTRGVEPEWSPDGRKLVFARGGVFISDGTSETIASTNPDARIPDWSPDGTTIAYADVARDTSSDVFSVRPEGSADTRLTNNFSSSAPSWSPDGSRIAFMRKANFGAPYNAWVMNRDGTGQTQLTTGSDDIEYPAWSPSGTRIAIQFRPGGGSTNVIGVMNADGTNATAISTGEDLFPDWGPPNSRYVRPKGATPIRVSLVPAYSPCGSPNSMHGAPLTFPSCTPPSQTSGTLTVGTPDANGFQANSVASERLDALAGDPSTPANEADVRFAISVSDVRRQSDLSPYPGTLAAVNTLRITDHDPSDGVAGTTQDIPFTVIVRCFLPPQTPPLPGSTCSAGTTANALVPGAVQEGNRTIWALDQVKLYDGGADDDATTTGDNTLFMDQGVFVP
jgi:dipeptidyl aminopeptidase/acylaminoacyl peptidase